MYKDGIAGIKYKVVSDGLRKEIITRNIGKRRSANNPMVIDLLKGKTIFAYGEEHRRKFRFGSLYTTAANNNKTLRIYQFDDVDDEIFKGYLIWMEKRSSLSKTG
jgi:hypothetical protein